MGLTVHRLVGDCMKLTVRIWDSTTGELLDIPVNRDWVASVTWSSDGRYLATSSGDKTTRIWDRTGKALFTMAGRADWVLAACWSPDSQYLATASVDQTARIWNPATGKVLRILTGKPPGTYDIRTGRPPGQAL